MRRLAFSCLLAAGWLLGPVGTGQAATEGSPTPAPGASASPSAGKPHEASEAVKKELTGIVDAQLAAFRANNYNKAFSFASTDLQSLFSPDEFEAMVKKTYPVIAHSASAEYGTTFDTGTEAVVNVRVQDADKKSVEYQYLFKKEEGGWKIGGVTEVKTAGLSA